MIRPTPVRMTILDPIPTADYTRKRKDDLLERVRATLTAHLADGRQES